MEWAWSGLTGQGSGLTGQAKALACQAGLTGRLAYGSPVCEHADRYFTDNEEYLEQHPRARAHDWKKNPMSLKEVDVLLAFVTAMGVVGMPTLR